MYFAQRPKRFVLGEKIKEKDTFGLYCCYPIKLVMKTYAQTVALTLKFFLLD